MPSVEKDEVRHGDESMKISGWGKSLKVGGGKRFVESIESKKWLGRRGTGLRADGVAEIRAKQLVRGVKNAEKKRTYRSEACITKILHNDATRDKHTFAFVFFPMTPSL